jgi:hypothetical protein
MGSDYTEQRDELLESIERDQEDLRVAVQELTGAARATFDLGERIKEHPLTWIIGGLVFGLWLGTRSTVPVVMARAASEGGRR